MAADVTADISPAEPQEDRFCTISDGTIKAARTWRITYGKTSISTDCLVFPEYSQR